MAASDTEQFFGPYRLVARLGHGGMGETWRAVHEGKAGVTKTVVIKRILQKHSASPRFRESFIQEARLSAQLNHGNVAHVFDFGEINGEYYMVMEHVNGRPLSHVLHRAEENGLSALPPPLVAYVGIGVLQGLAHAHGLTDATGKPLDIVHRDVSPDNVILSYEGEVKLLDFGIARAQLADREQTLPGTFKGKINFVSPEQARGQPVDARSDLWSVGLTLYRLLSGKQPGDDEHPTRARTASAKNAPVARRPEVPTQPSAARVSRDAPRFRKRSTLAFLAGCVALGAIGVSAGAYFLVPPRPAVTPAPEPPPPPAAAVEPTQPPPPVDPAAEAQRRREAAEAAEIAAARAEIAAARAARDREILEKIERDRQAVKTGKRTRPAKPARLPRGVGALSLSTVNPTQAEIFFEKKALGPTPFIASQLPAGRQTLRVFDSDWKARKLEVLVVEGKVSALRGVDVTSLPYLDPPPTPEAPEPNATPTPAPVATPASVQPPREVATTPAMPTRLVLRGVVSVGAFTIDLDNHSGITLTRCRLWVPPNLSYEWPPKVVIGPREFERVSRAKFTDKTKDRPGWDKNFSLLECAEGSGHLKTER